MISNPRFHRGRYSQGSVSAAEIEEIGAPSGAFFVSVEA
jgi:hypothetical protein